jgi:formylmethanofuran dehydrogenase subunit E
MKGVMMIELTSLLERSLALHDHLCPRQVIGVRMGLYAGNLLSLGLPQTSKRLYTFIETDGCFADGIAVATGCTLGHRTLRLMDYGKVAATFVDTETERAARIVPHSFARERAAQRFPELESHWRAQLEAYQIMPDVELFEAQDVSLNLSLMGLISRAGVRVNCEACGEEILNEREVVIGGQTLCKSCAGECYWSPVNVYLETALVECG